MEVALQEEARRGVAADNTKAGDRGEIGAHIAEDTGAADSVLSLNTFIGFQYLRYPLELLVARRHGLNQQPLTAQATPAPIIPHNEA